MRRLNTIIMLPFICLFFAALGSAEELSVKSVSVASDWQAGKTQEIHLEITLPEKFHAYSDQFKTLNISPSGFKVGQIIVHNEISFFDKYTKKNRKGIYEKGKISVLVEPPDSGFSPQEKISFDLRHQICSDSVCYLPKNIHIEINTAKLNTPADVITAPVKDTFSLLKSFEEAMKTSLLLSFLSVFIAGVLTSFTPCIFPMLPITFSILGHNAHSKDRLHNFLTSVSYVLGIAVTYSSLGVLAAVTGGLFGGALANKYVLFVLVLLFFAMALSMWGAYEIQSPAFIRNKFGVGAKSRGFGGAFVMGLVAGVVASPCVGPVLVSILSYVSTTKNVVLGFSLLFTFALGLGMIFLVIGLFSSALKLLPKSGKWMDFIKFVLGAGMWAAALYYAQFLLSENGWIILVAASFIAMTIWKGAFKFRQKNHAKQSLLLVIFIFSTAVLIMALFKPQYLSAAFKKPTEVTAKSDAANWIMYSEEAMIMAQKESKPVMLDFFAEWCGACHELEEKTFSTPEFKQLSKEFVLLRFDATEDNEATQAVLKKFKVKGLPTVLFMNRNGVSLDKLSFTQFLEIGELKVKMQEALKDE